MFLRIIGSFLSAVVGTVAGAATAAPLIHSDGELPVIYDFFVALPFVALMVLPLWLIAVLPLYLLVPRSSILWHRRSALLLGASSARFFYSFWRVRTSYGHSRFSRLPSS
jgi:hypothetical protein